MKKHLLKYLIALNFLILAMPFFQTCSNDSIVLEQAEKNLHNKKMHSPSQQTQNERADEITKRQQELTSNGYQLFYNSNTKFSFEIEDFYGVPFLLVPLFTFALFLFSFTKRQKLIVLLSILQFLGSISELITLFHACDDIHQVKYGMYLFVINSGVIAFFRAYTNCGKIKIVSIARSQRNPTQAY
jgi:ABC-type maltose transport system permease subunit